VHRRWQSLGQGPAEVLERQPGSADGRPALKSGWKLFAALEGAVPDQLGIDAAVARVVDVLRVGSATCRCAQTPRLAYLVHDAILNRTRGVAAGGLHRDLVGGARPSEGQAGHGGRGEVHHDADQRKRVCQRFPGLWKRPATCSYIHLDLVLSSGPGEAHPGRVPLTQAQRRGRAARNLVQGPLQSRRRSAAFRLARRCLSAKCAYPDVDHLGVPGKTRAIVPQLVARDGRSPPELSSSVALDWRDDG